MTSFIPCICSVLILTITSVHVVKGGSSGGTVYTRWGRKDCPGSAKLIYSGFAGGSYYTHKGAAVDPLCLPTDPQWGSHNSWKDGHRGLLYGAEYKGVPSDFVSHLVDHDVPCAVCETVGEKSVIVIPARTSCYSGWKTEYSGYLMSGNYDYEAGSVYSCVDRYPQTVIGGSPRKNGYLFYLVEGRCGSLKCPPYMDGWEITCVVCSKA
ncbi:short-chain collagen C4-like [Saccostrea cucullata]|uniref:short-chain collagen C4-like n=1 Tax=Saccostrea cuccullata TaxID=36930 RepID=UPI002ED69D95